MKFVKKALSIVFAHCLFLVPVFLPLDAHALFSSQPYIPDSIVALSSGYAIVVDKQNQKLYVFKKNGDIVKVFEAPCSTGKKPGAKQEPGDAKTPNGIFFVQKYYTGSELTSIYGPMAFHLDFPNVVDRRAGRNGTNIWIHGTNKPLQPNQSNGCIAMRNGDIELLAGYIFLNKTPVIIEESIRWIPQDKKNPDREDLEKLINIWDRAVNEGDARTLETMYMSDSRDKIDQKSIVQKSYHLKSLVHHIAIQPRDISILKQDNNAVVLFDKISSVRSDMSFQGAYVKLFLQKTKDHWLIVEDVNKSGYPLLAARNGKTVVKEQPPAVPVQTPPVQQVLPQKPVQATVQQTVPQKPVTAVTAPVQQVRPAVVSAQKPAAAPPAPPAQVRQKTTPPEDAAINRLVDQWAASWQSGNMKEYRSCFSPEFKSKGMNLSKYIDYKEDLARKYKKISVRVSDVKISYSGDQHATVTFKQKYSASGGLKTSGMKKLELRKIKDAWKIQREVMGR